MRKALSTFVIIGVIFGLMMTVMNCSSKETVEVIDLNKVLDVMTATLDELKDTPVEGVDANSDTIQPVSNEEQNTQHLETFTQAFAKNLNDSKMMNAQMGAAMLNDGAIEGFVDTNKDNKKDPTEKQLFTVEIDTERNRLIATDTQNQYRRDAGFRPGGLFMGYFLGSMLGRQMGAGISPSRYSNMKMNSKNYHKAAVSKAKATSSARVRSSSGSFRSGK